MPSDSDVLRLERVVGHPEQRLLALLAHVADHRVKQFADVQEEWLGLMWCLDAYRRFGVVPRAMGSSKNKNERLAAIYRGKGNWFAQLLAALLENRTTQRIAPVVRVQGFSQVHQIDLAWPDRGEDPLVCAETKVTGAPAYGQYPERGAMADFTNRRKELKFAATDLKLFRRDRDTVIEHWDAWREMSPPKAYFLWAARLRRGHDKALSGGRHRVVSADDIALLAREADALVKTYLDGAGLFAWRVNQAGTGYEAVALAASERVTELDDVLHKIASQIKQLVHRQGEPPAPVLPRIRAVGDVGESLSPPDGI